MAQGEGPSGGEQADFRAPEQQLAPTLQGLEQMLAQEMSGQDPSITTESGQNDSPEHDVQPEAKESLTPGERADQLIGVQADVFAARRAIQLDGLHTSFDVIAAAEAALAQAGDTRPDSRPAIHSLQVAGQPARPTSGITVPTEAAAPQPEVTGEAGKALGIPWNVGWERVFPDGGSAMPQEARDQAYQSFLRQLPPDMAPNVMYLRELRREESRLVGDPETMTALESLKEGEREVRRMAAHVIRAERLVESVELKHIMRRAIYKGQHGENAKLPQGEQMRFAAEDRLAAEFRESVEALLMKPGVKQEVVRIHTVERARELRRGYLETRVGRDIIASRTTDLVQGKPMLLKGETGGAKTALAKHIAEMLIEIKPHVEGEPDQSVEFISLHESITSNDIMGRIGLSAGADGSTITVFRDGPMARAMQAGVPIILDEINMAAVGGLGRLHEIMDLRPGDTMVIQEDTGKKITVAQGFVIIATANEASERYERNRLDSALKQRFEQGSGIHPVPYPDSKVPIKGLPKENLELALAQLTLNDGAVGYPAGLAPEGSHLDPGKELYAFVQAAMHTQRLFTAPPADADTVGQSAIGSGSRNKPALKEAVLSPRIILATLGRLQQNPDLTLSRALAELVAGYSIDTDRSVMATVLASYGLLDGVSEADLNLPAGSLAGLLAEAA